MLTNAEAATLAGVAAGTWRDYVSKGYAPPCDERDRWGHPLWLEETVTAWLVGRPGRGARTDLRS